MDWESSLPILAVHIGARAEIKWDPWKPTVKGIGCHGANPGAIRSKDYL